LSFFFSFSFCNASGHTPPFARSLLW